MVYIISQGSVWNDAKTINVKAIYENKYPNIQPYIQILLAILDTTHFSFVITTVSLMLIWKQIQLKLHDDTWDTTGYAS